MFPFRNVWSLALCLVSASLCAEENKIPATAAAPVPANPAPAAPSGLAPVKGEEKVAMPADRFVDLFKPFRTEIASLSPDGKYLAYSVREGENIYVLVVEADKPSVATAKVTVASDSTSTAIMTDTREKTPAVIRWMRWATPTRVVVETNQNFSHSSDAGWANTDGAVLAFDFDGKNSRTLLTPKDVAEVLPNASFGPASAFSSSKIKTPDMPATTPNLAAPAEIDAASPSADPFATPTDDPTQTVITRSEISPRSLRVIDLAAKDPDSILIRTAGLQKYDVFKLNIQTAKLSFLSSEAIYPEDLPLLDRQGKARVVVPSSTKTAFPHRFSLEKRSGISRWTDLDKIAGFSGPGFSVSPENFMGERAIPLGFDEDPNILYFASNVGRDTYGIYSLDLKTGKRGALAVENPNFDLVQPSSDEFPRPGTLVYNRFTRKLAGIRFESRMRTAAWLTPALEEVQKQLEANFKGRSVELQEWDISENRFLVLVRGPADPGAYYIFDRAAKKLTEFVERAPWLETKETNTTMDFALDNPKGGVLSGLITLPRTVRMQPIPIVVLCENEPWQRTRSDFRAEMHALADMGFAVVQVNGRGAWGYGIQQREAIKVGYEEAQVEDISNSLSFLEKQFPFLNPKRIAIMGEDRGAYLALRASQIDPKLFRCAVAINPTVDLAGWIAEARWTTGASGPALIKAFFGDAARLKAAPLKNHPEMITTPTCIFSYPGPLGGPRNLYYLDARQFSSSVKSHQTPVEFYDLNDDYVDRLPAARAQVLRQTEDFLNTYIYAYKVDVKETVPLKD